MGDLISRQWLMECVEEGWIKFDTEIDKNKFIHLVRDTAPSAEPEIIRCKDCKWWGRKDTYKDGSSMIVCKKGRSIESDGFCHYAERRTDD